MWILYVLKLTQRVIIYGCINDPGNGRRKIDGINGAGRT